MTGRDSLFSCIKNPPGAEDYAAGLGQPHPPAPPSAPPARAPTGQVENLTAKIAELEDKIKKLEAKNSAPAPAAADGLKTDLQAALGRISGLERVVAGLQQAAEGAAREKREAKVAAAPALDQVMADLAALRTRAGAVEETCRRIDLADLDGIGAGIGALGKRLNDLETGVVCELNERCLSLDSAFGKVSRKASVSHETAAGSARRVDKLEERLARLSYLENRLASNESKLERIYDLEAIVQALKVSVEGAENNSGLIMREAAGISAEHKKIRSDFESISHQVKHLAVLFNHFRAELSFLMPKNTENADKRP
jgi:archaellum component FlaC